MTRPFRIALVALLSLGVLSGPLHAACYADYRARMDNPLRLHYGVIRIPDTPCDLVQARDEIEEEVSDRIATDGWNLLEVISVFGEDGLASRRADAADFFLAF